MDFRHPFISNPKLAIYYAFFWLAAGSANVMLLYFGNDVELGTAVIEVFTFLITFSIIGTAIWYVIKYSTLENNNAAHAIAASIIVFIWIYFGIVIIKLLHPNAEIWLKQAMVNRIFGGYMLYVIYMVFFYAVNYYQEFKEKVRNEGELKALVKDNPHFLFNSLNSISSLTMTNPERAQEMVINLSQLMRYSLKHDQKERVTLKQELENNKLYMQIEKVRFGNKLNPIFEVDRKCLKASIPNMILQPLYENAIKYGVYETIEPVDIITVCECNDEVLEVTIRNTYDSAITSKKGEGIGLRNIRERMQIIFGNPNLLQIHDDKKEFTVTLTIPQK